MKGGKEISIDQLIKDLQEEKDKGATVVQFKGTLMCEENGNMIILSTEPQW